MEAKLNDLSSKVTNWTLAEDNALGSLLDQLSKDLGSRCSTLTTRLETIRKTARRLDAAVQNFNVDISHLANTKFIEVLVDEDNSVSVVTSSKGGKLKSAENERDEVISSVHVAINSGLALISSRFKEVPMETPSGPCFQFEPLNTPPALPTMIGSSDFFSEPMLDVEETSISWLTAPQSQIENHSIPPAPPPPPIPSCLPVAPQIQVETPPESVTKIIQKDSVVPKASAKSLFDDDDSSQSSIEDQSTEVPTLDSPLTKEERLPEDRGVASAPSSEVVKSVGPPVLNAADILAASARLRKGPTSTDTSSSQPAGKPLPKSSPPKEEHFNNSETKQMANGVGVSQQREPFERPANPSEVPKPSVTASYGKPKVVSSIFESASDESDTDLFKPVVKPEIKRTSGITPVTDKSINRGPSREQVSASNKVSAPANAVTNKETVKLPSKLLSKSIFDSDSDDDDLFSVVKAPKTNGRSASPAQPPSSPAQPPSGDPIGKQLKNTPRSEQAEVAPVVEPVVVPVTPPVESTGTISPPTVAEQPPTNLTSDTAVSASSPLSLKSTARPPEADNMAKKLDKSAFASLLNGKLAGGPPSTRDTKPISKAVDSSQSIVSRNVPNGGPSYSAEPSTSFMDKPHPLPSVNKSRTRGPARRPPSKRGMPDPPTPSAPTTSSNEETPDVTDVERKLSRLSANEPVLDDIDQSAPTPSMKVVVQPEDKSLPKKSLFDSDSDDDIFAAPTSALPQPAVQQHKHSVPAPTSAAKPARKGLFDDSDDEDLSLFMKK